MTPINNSDTAWLIVSDYNQDNSLPYEDLKEDVINPNINCWYCEYKYGGVGSGHIGSSQCGNGYYIGVGDGHNTGVDVGGGIISYYVGGVRSNSRQVGGHDPN